MTTDEIFLLYYDAAPEVIETLDLCRGDADYRKIYITTDGKRKLVIKHTSNSFTNAARISAWDKLNAAYNEMGVYCPRMVNNRDGKLCATYTENDREYCVYAEEFAKYDTVEHLGENNFKNENGRPRFYDDILRSVGRVASARLDLMDFPSAYCMLEPHSPPDTTDEGTECAELFLKNVEKHAPSHSTRAQELVGLFYKNQAVLREVYPLLPTSCFQADLNDSNVLLDENGGFAGHIDFNLSGREPSLNYLTRTAMYKIEDDRIVYADGKGDPFWYDEAVEKLRTDILMHNFKIISETYDFTDLERQTFPKLLRYMNSFWWQHAGEIERIKDDETKLDMLFGWLERQMTRDDLRLP